MKTMILVYSIHHGNTAKLAEALKAALPEEIDLVDMTKEEVPDLSEYDRIGLASGVYAGNFGKPALAALEKSLPEGKDVFFLYTSAMPLDSHPSKARQIVANKHGKILGEYRCAGYNTFGPFKLVGGTSKGHPTADEIQAAVTFYKGL